MFEIPFIYLVLTAFQLLLQYDDRNKVLIKDLKKYTKFIVDELKEISKESDDFDGEIKDIDFDTELDFILNEYPNLFKLENDTLVINPQFTLLDVSLIVSCFEIFKEEMSVLTHTKESWEYLNINKIKDKIEAYKNNERHIEKIYESSGEYKEATMENLLNLRNLQNIEVFSNGIFYIEKVWVYLTLLDLTDDEEEKERSYNQKFYKNSKYAELIKNEGADNLDLDVMMNNAFQKAIFSNEPIFKKKFEDMVLSLMYFRDVEERDKYALKYESTKESDQIEEFDENVQREMFSILGIEDMDSVEIGYREEGLDLEIPIEYIKRTKTEGEDQFVLSFTLEEDNNFYLLYLKKIDEYEEAYGLPENFVQIRKRLIYLLDNCAYKLYNKEKRLELYKTLDINLDEFYLTRYKLEAEYFIEEIFSTTAVKVLEKLLFISTYYELTHDKEIETLLSKYSDNKDYKKYKEIILCNKNINILKKNKNN